MYSILVVNSEINQRNCPVCHHESWDLIHEFRSTPLGDLLSESHRFALEKKKYPLRLVSCLHCKHLFLPDVISPDLSYSEYLFNSASSPALLDFMKDSIDWLRNEFPSLSSGLVIDIGANDGTFLQLFKNLGYQCLGIEPSPQYEQMKNLGIQYFNSYFNNDCADAILKSCDNSVKASFITVNNTIANVPDLSAFLENVIRIMDIETVFSITTGYHLDQFAAGMFDYIYHEHLSYFTLNDFQALASQFGLTIVAARKTPLKGGSIQVAFKKTAELSGRLSNVISNMLMWEDWVLNNHGDYFQNLRKALESHFTRSQLVERYSTNSSKKLVGYGMSHSVTTLIYQMQLESVLSFLVDDNPSRHGLFAPGTGLQIREPATLLDENCDVIILAWQHDTRIMNRLKDLGFTGAVHHPFQRMGIQK